MKPDLICITETSLPEQKSSENFNLDGYHPLLYGFEKKRGGDVGHYKKETFRFGVEKKLTTNKL